MPRPDHHIASAEGCGACLGPTAISRAPDAVVIQCAVRLSFVIEAVTFRPGDAWRVGIARNLVFSHIHKVTPGVDVGSLVCATGAVGTRVFPIVSAARL